MDTFNSGGAEIQLEVFRPSSSDQHPVVIVVYGTRGLSAPFGDAIRNFARTLTDEGFVVAIPYYFNRTGTPESNSPAGDAEVIGAFLSHQDTWIDTIKDCTAYVATLADVKGDQIGLLGFSMGGHIALRLAKQAITPKIKAVVEFFAPITQFPFQGIGDNIDKLPPVQIHYGDNDPIVPPEQSTKLQGLLNKVGKVEGTDYEIYHYPGEEHGFETETAISDSTARTIHFFKKHI
jgi:dienelactone hydrolase